MWTRRTTRRHSSKGASGRGYGSDSRDDGPLPHGDPHLSVDWHGVILDCRGGGISTGITLGIAGSARQGQGTKLMDLQRSVHLHKCTSGEDIEEESVVAAADLHFDDLVKVYTGQLIP